MDNPITVMYLDECRTNCFVVQALWYSFSSDPERGFGMWQLMQRNDQVRKRIYGRIKLLACPCVSETGSDTHSEHSKRGYHLWGMTPCAYYLIAQGKQM